MTNLRSIFKRTAVMSIASLQLFAISLFGFSGFVMASETPAPTTPEASVTYAPCPQSSGTISPTGSASATYTFNPATCLWENAYYSWNPVTKVTSPKYDQTPVLNTAGTAWEYVEWYYSPAAGIYKQRTISIPVPQAAPSNSNSGGQANGGSSSPYGPDAPNSPTGNSSRLIDGSSVSNTGPNSNNGLNGSNSNSLNYNLANNTSIFTGLNSFAGSGDALVMGNTYGGNATSGDAEAVANYLNMIQSAWNPSMGPISTFNAALQGSYFGDIMFNPDAVIKTTGPDSNNTVNNSTNNDLTINAVENSSITNDINLGAQSGNATVSGNTNGGDATTGDATTVANLINMINSRIASGGSFIGNVNIYGDLDGDLLLPASVLAQLKNTGPNSNNTIANDQNTDINIDIARNNTIINNVDLSAESGNAIVDSNTNAGSATSGSATTGLKQADIVGKNVSGTKGLLVFVNVLGKWTGMIWDGNGFSSVENTGPNSNNQISQNGNTNIDANLEQNNTIVNNINLASKTGDAVVSSNTNAGSARSGDASSSANILNLIDSDVNFTDWFGVLFINVFGTWNGSFGVNTAAGNAPTPPKPSTTTSSGSGNTTSPNGGSTANVSNVTSTVARVVGSSRSIVGGSGSVDSNTAPQTSSTSTSKTGTTASVASSSNPVSPAAASSSFVSGSTLAWSGLCLFSIACLAYLNRTRLGLGKAS